MKRYCFYIKSDITKEKISCGYYSDIEEARKGFSTIKGLDINEFNKLFEVELYE